MKTGVSAFRGFGSFVVLCILLFGRVVLAQNATHNGTVLDNAGAAVPGAHITVVNTGTNATQAGESNDQGVYSIGQLAPGSYTVTVERTGFRKVVETGIVLTVNQSATLNIPLQIGGLEQTISVSADAALINATTAEISTVVDQHAISQLPLNGRDPSSLVFLATFRATKA